MSSRARFWLILTGLVCGGYGLSAIAIYAIYFGRQPWQDWMVYYTAAQSYLEGNLTLIFDGERFTAHMNARFADWLPRPLSFHPWLYPPSYLLPLIPFGLLPFATACLLFLAATLAALVAVLLRIADRGYRRWLYIGSLLLAPATAFNVGTGQNGFLSAALLVGGFGLLRDRPGLAGVLLGLLAYKPQLCLLAPVALVAARQWQALASAAATAALIALVSIAVLGIDPWRVWFDWFINAPPDIYRTWVKWGRLHGQSVYTNLALLGAPHIAATAGQWLAAAAAGICVWSCWRRPMADDLRLTALLAATVLAAPHVTNYDMVLLVVGATLVFAHGLDHGFGHGELIVPVLVWMVQLFNPPGAFRLGLITPVLTALLIVVAFAAARSSVAGGTPAGVARASA